jgi:tetratricopeptide (TPR) repeat protein
VTAFRNSLGELPRDRLPLDWADAQHNFSMALVRLGEHEDDTELLYQALAAINCALEEWTFEGFPFDWAIAQNTLAGVLIRLGERETETRILRFESAVAACQKSFQVQRKDTSPFQWALTQNTLGLALHGLGQAQNDIVKLGEAESVYSSALEVFRAISDAKHVGYLGNNLRIVQALIEGHRNTVSQEVRP